MIWSTVGRPPLPDAGTDRIPDPAGTGPSATRRTPGARARSDTSAVTWAGPAAITTLQRRCSRLARYGAAAAGVDPDITGRYSTLARVASDACCIPDHAC